MYSEIPTRNIQLYVFIKHQWDKAWTSSLEAHKPQFKDSHP